MAFKFPRLLGEINDRDTQFTAALKKNQFIVMIAGFLLVCLVVIMIASSIFGGKRMGTWRYGLCKVFLEQYASYPLSLVILTAEESRNAAEIGYLMTNSYGAQKSEVMKCFYSVQPQSVVLERVTIDRESLQFLKRNNNVGESSQSETNSVAGITEDELRQLYVGGDDGSIAEKVEQMHIDEFNKSIPVIMESDELDLEMPSNLSSNLLELKYN